MELDTLPMFARKKKHHGNNTKCFSRKKLDWAQSSLEKTIEVRQDLGSESVEPQVVDKSPAVDEIPEVDGSRAIEESQLKTTDSTQEAVKTHLNVGAQAAGVMNDKSSHVTKTEESGRAQSFNRKKISP